MKKIFTTLFLSFIGLQLFAISLFPPTPSLPAQGAVNVVTDAFLKWGPVPGAFNYQVQISSDTLFGSIYEEYTTNLAALNATSLMFNTKYFWRVRAMNASDTSGWSNVYSFTTINMLTITKPAAGAANRPIRTYVAYSGISGLTTYEYEADTSLTFSSPCYVHGYRVPTRSYLFTETLCFGQHYHVRIRAINPVDTSAWSNPVDFYTLDTFLLRKPYDDSTKVMPLAIFGWDWAGSPVYDLRISEDSTFSNYTQFTVDSSQVVRQWGIDTFMYDISDTLMFNKTYYWMVRARNVTDTSKWCGIWNYNTIEKVIHSAPVNGTLNVSVTPKFEWKGMYGIKKFQLQIDTTTLFATPIVYNLSDTLDNFTIPADFPLEFSTVYYWRMLAISAVDTTVWSTAWQFRTLVDVGITEPALNRTNVSVFPNPSLDGKINISINSTSAQQIDVSVVNMVGQEVVSGKFGLKQGSNLIPLQLGNNETGIFFINIRNNASAYTTKIVVNQ